MINILAEKLERREYHNLTISELDLPRLVAKLKITSLWKNLKVYKNEVEITYSIHCCMKLSWALDNFSPVLSCQNSSINVTLSGPVTPVSDMQVQVVIFMLVMDSLTMLSMSL